jgi:Rps23 Pro-64 3,4-dihydroxylase Tpa1-like proline 4-hydroxylase
MDIRINPALDAEALASCFQEKGRLQVADFFDADTAGYLYRLLEENRDWSLTYNEGQENFESPLEAFQALPAQQKQRFMNSVYTRAADGFQYLFNQYYISQAIELGEQPGHPMHAFHGFMNQPDTLDFMRRLTGQTDIRKADAYASWYAPGHFLTEHDDIHGTHDRVAALVFSMTKGWNRNWGGHLAFFDERGNIVEAYVPGFNTLNIFLIPQRHAVQFVSPFARARRTSYLSWLHR